MNMMKEHRFVTRGTHKFSSAVMSNCRAGWRWRLCRFNAISMMTQAHTDTFFCTRSLSHTRGCCLVLLVNGSDVWIVKRLHLHPRRRSASSCVGSSFVGGCSSVPHCYIGYSRRYSYSVCMPLGPFHRTDRRISSNCAEGKRVFTCVPQSITKCLWYLSCLVLKCRNDQTAWERWKEMCLLFLVQPYQCFPSC